MAYRGSIDDQGEDDAWFKADARATLQGRYGVLLRAGDVQFEVVLHRRAHFPAVRPEASHLRSIVEEVEEIGGRVGVEDVTAGAERRRSTRSVVAE